MQTADLVSGIRAPFVSDIHQLRGFAANLDANQAELDRALQVLPIKLTKVGRTAIYGSWFNFYLCDFSRSIRIGRTPARRLRHRLAQVQSRMIPPMSTPFRERNPVDGRGDRPRRPRWLILLALQGRRAAVIGGGDTYYAEFSEAGGLKVNDEVRIAGVRVGKVDDGHPGRATSRSRSRSTAAPSSAPTPAPRSG